MPRKFFRKATAFAINVASGGSRFITGAKGASSKQSLGDQLKTGFKNGVAGLGMLFGSGAASKSDFDHIGRDVMPKGNIFGGVGDFFNKAGSFLNLDNMRRIIRPSSGLSGGVTFGKNQTQGLIPIVLATAVAIVIAFGSGLIKFGRKKRRR